MSVLATTTGLIYPGGTHVLYIDGTSTPAVIPAGALVNSIILELSGVLNASADIMCGDESDGEIYMSRGKLVGDTFNTVELAKYSRGGIIYPSAQNTLTLTIDGTSEQLATVKVLFKYEQVSSLFT